MKAKITEAEWNLIRLVRECGSYPEEAAQALLELAERGAYDWRDITIIEHGESEVERLEKMFSVINNFLGEGGLK